MKQGEIDKLKLFLEKYKEETLNLISALENEQYDKLEEALNCRQQLIDSISEVNYETQVFKELCSRLNLISLQQKLQSEMNIKKANLQDELNKIGDKTIANKSYNKKLNMNSLYFNKKV